MVRSTNPRPAEVERLILNGGTSPQTAPLKIVRSAAPSYQEAGDVYINSTTGRLGVSDGTSFIGGGGPFPIYTTTQVLTTADNNAHCVFSVTTVTTYTLPAAQAGLRFWFSCAATAAGTADIFRIVCATGDFFIGTFIQSTDGTYTSAAHDANGTTHLAWEGNGSTTGGLKGDWLMCTASSGTLWQVFGMGRATGTEATPWKTS